MTELVLDKHHAPEKLIASLSDRFALETGAEAHRTITYYDTFSWSLMAHGSRIEQISENSTTVTEWRSNKTDALLGRLQGGVKPFAGQWPPGPVAGRLAAVTTMRALLPLAALKVSATPVSVLASRKKTVVRASLESAQVLSTGGKVLASLEPRIKLTPVKGFEKEYKRVLDYLTGTLGLAPADESTVTLALKANGLTPLGYSSKVDVPLRPDMPAEEALRAVFSALLDIMGSNLEGTINDLDTEFLHDFRVAVRRTRSGLTQMKDAIPPPVQKKFAERFGWLGKVTGPTRDLDVYLLKFDDYAGLLGTGDPRELEPLRAHIEKRQRQEQKKLVRALHTKKCAGILSQWRTELETPWRHGGPGWQGTLPVVEAAGTRILKLHKRAIAEGRAITDDSPGELVHELRKTCKKLRYMIEFFQPLYAKAKTTRLVKALKGLQDVLGDFNDFEVHREQLNGFAEELSAEGHADARTLMLMGELVAALAARQAEVRTHLGGEFERFASDANTRAFRKIFSTDDKTRSHADEGGSDL